MDLDGTLAEYHGWVSVEHIGPPIRLMVERVKRWLAEGHEVRIFTARAQDIDAVIIFGDDVNGVSAVRDFIEKWCLEHIGTVLPITNKKDYGMIELWDDRCVQVVANTGEIVGNSTRGL